MNYTVRTQAEIDALPPVIDGSLRIEMGGAVVLPRLASAWEIIADAAKSLSFPVLAAVGDIYANSARSLSFPALTAVRDIYANAATYLNINGIETATPQQERASIRLAAAAMFADGAVWDQSTFGPRECPSPECGTPMCFAGFLRATDPRPKVRAMRPWNAGMLLAPRAFQRGAFEAEAESLVRKIVREAYPTEKKWDEAVAKARRDNSTQTQEATK